MRIHLASLVLGCTYEHAHQTCSHTWHHPDIGALNNDQLDQQDQLVQEALCKILGVVPACTCARCVCLDPAKYFSD